MKGMTGFMQDGLDIALHADCVHENERQPRLRERGLITTRRFAFAVGQVKQAQIVHPLETAGQVRIEPRENLL